MQFIALVPLALVAAGIFGATFAVTLRNYRALPAQVPEHFDEYGSPDQMGPRPMIFSMLVAQAIVLAIWIAMLANTLRGADALRLVVISGIIADSLLGMLAWLQWQMIEVAEGRLERMPHQYAPLLLPAAGVAIAFAIASAIR